MSFDIFHWPHITLVACNLERQAGRLYIRPYWPKFDWQCAVRVHSRVANKWKYWIGLKAIKYKWVHVRGPGQMLESPSKMTNRLILVFYDNLKNKKETRWITQCTLWYIHEKKHQIWTQRTRVLQFIQYVWNAHGDVLSFGWNLKRQNSL